MFRYFSLVLFISLFFGCGSHIKTTIKNSDTDQSTQQDISGDNFQQPTQIGTAQTVNINKFEEQKNLIDKSTIRNMLIMELKNNVRILQDNQMYFTQEMEILKNGKRNTSPSPLFQIDLWKSAKSIGINGYMSFPEKLVDEIEKLYTDIMSVNQQIDNRNTVVLTLGVNREKLEQIDSGILENLSKIKTSIEIMLTHLNETKSGNGKLGETGDIAYLN